MRIKLIPLSVIKRKQRHCLFNQNLNLDNNDYLLLLLIILILDQAEADETLTTFEAENAREPYRP